MDKNSNLDALVDELLEVEKKSFQPGLESFAMHAAKLREKIHEAARQFNESFSHGYATLKEMLKERGVEVPDARPEAAQILQDPVAFQKGLEEGKDVYRLLGYSRELMQQFLSAACELVKAEEYAKALDAFTFLVTIDAYTPAFWLGQAISNEQSGNFREAANGFLKAIDLNPTYPDAYVGCIRALIKQNSFDEAFNVCETGLEIAEANSNAAWAEKLKSHLENAKSSIKNLRNKQ